MVETQPPTFSFYTQQTHHSTAAHKRAECNPHSHYWYILHRHIVYTISLLPRFISVTKGGRHRHRRLTAMSPPVCIYARRILCLLCSMRLPCFDTENYATGFRPYSAILHAMHNVYLYEKYVQQARNIVGLKRAQTLPASGPFRVVLYIWKMM